MSIFYIHYLVADIIGCFYQVNQRITGKAKRVVTQTDDAEIVGNAAVILLFGGEKAELILPPLNSEE